MNPKSVEDEPLFVEDFSDFDMEEILREPRKLTETATDDETTKEAFTRRSSNVAERDEFEDEMDALNDIGKLHE